MSGKTSLSHKAWAGGHATVLASSIYALIGLVTFHPHPRAYQIAYAGALVSWGIVVYKSLGVPTLSRAYFSRAMLDENVQYLILALFWFTQRPIYISLIPFATFSLFHTLNFVRTLLPRPKPGKTTDKKTDEPTTSADQAGQQQSQLVQLNKSIQTWVKHNYERAMLFVSYIEVIVILGRVVFGALTFQTPFTVPLIYVHFLRLRYYLSPQIRQAFAYVSAQLDHLTNHPSCPAVVKQGVTTLKSMVVRYAQLMISVPNAQEAGGAPRPNGR